MTNRTTWSRLLVVGLLGTALAVSCGPAREESAGSGETDTLSIGVMPKLVGIDYFNACERGAREAAAELGVELTYDGPVTNDVTKQAEMLDAWITRRFDVIAVAPNDPHALAPTLKRAAAQGIEVLTWDADSDEDSRAYFVNQAPSSGVRPHARRGDGGADRGRGRGGDRDRVAHRGQPERLDGAHAGDG